MLMMGERIGRCVRTATATFFVEDRLHLCNPFELRLEFRPLLARLTEKGIHGGFEPLILGLQAFEFGARGGRHRATSLRCRYRERHRLLAQRDES